MVKAARVRGLFEGVRDPGERVHYTQYHEAMQLACGRTVRGTPSWDVDISNQQRSTYLLSWYPTALLLRPGGFAGVGPRLL